MARRPPSTPAEASGPVCDSASKEDLRSTDRIEQPTSPSQAQEELIFWTWSDERHCWVAEGRELQPTASGSDSTRWEWDDDAKDWVKKFPNGQYIRYADYQKPPTRLNSESRGFEVVKMPKRFFIPGRIFKMMWYEPAPEAQTELSPDSKLDKKCQAFGEEAESRPIARYRWFVVVQRRYDHSICFSVTTYKKGASKTSRSDNVAVLYRVTVDPPLPYDDEKFMRTPIAVIVEDPEHYIAPTARLDCKRVYTVEDGMKVKKIGRVHPRWVPVLEKYYQQAVNS